MKENKTQDIGELTSILHSKSFYEIIEERKKYLQGEVNNFVRQENLIKAYGALSKLDDVDQLIKMMAKRLEELNKK